jgi:hypothetical protein
MTVLTKICILELIAGGDKMSLARRDAMHHGAIQSSDKHERTIEKTHPSKP